MANSSSVRNNIWKWVVLGVIAAVSFYVCNPPSEKLRFGLDLKGGTSFTLGVDVDRLTESIIAANPGITNTAGAVERKVAETLKGCDERIIQVIRRRVDAMGTNEPVIQGMKDHRLLVQLPGADEEVRKVAKANLQSAAFLEFRLTHPKNDQLVAKLLGKEVAPPGYVKGGRGYAKAPDWAEVSKQPGYAARLAAFETPDARYRFMLEDNGDGTFSPSFVSRKTELTGESLVSAAVERDPTTGTLAIGFRLNSEGARIFSTLTRNYKAHGPKNPGDRGRQLAIVLDEQLVSAPVINGEIGANGQITGHFDPASARKLAAELNAGALPAPMKILAETSVSPTVGEDAKEAGIVAAALGFSLVAIFMLIYYWYAGLVADIALFLDVALLPTALVVVANVLGVFAHDPSMGGGGSMQLPVLTMPGIAGLVLTLGMAVDANVLIFERIREEFAAGKAAGESVRNGYARAFTAIFDSNLTTIITGVILFVVGTGPVRGFAITLTAGVAISMFTALVVTRLVFDHTVNPDSMKPFRMLHFFKNAKYRGGGDLLRPPRERPRVGALRRPHWRHLDRLQPQKRGEAGRRRRARDAEGVRQRGDHPVPGGRRLHHPARQDRRDRRDREGLQGGEQGRRRVRDQAPAGEVPGRRPRARVGRRGRLDGRRGPQEERHLRGALLARGDPRLRRIPLPLRLRPRRDRRARPRRAHLARPLLALRPPGVAHRDYRGADDHRLLGERYGGRVRPHPRAAAP